MTSVFVVQHSRKTSENAEDVKMIGVYASHAEALDAIARLKLKPGFAEIPEIVLSGQDAAEGFFVDEYEVGKDHWIEGFVTV